MLGPLAYYEYWTGDLADPDFCEDKDTEADDDGDDTRKVGDHNTASYYMQSCMYLKKYIHSLGQSIHKLCIYIHLNGYKLFDNNLEYIYLVAGSS